MPPTKIKVLLSDITNICVDAIVNAANTSLMGGGGVDGAIHHAGGPAILEECMAIVAKQGGCKTGEAVITTGGNLPAKFVIHTVGPVWHGGDQQEVKKLKQCYENCIRLAVENNCATIAFPNISTGAYGFPKEDAAKIAVHTVAEAIKNQEVIKEVIFVCFDKTNFGLVEGELNLLDK